MSRWQGRAVGVAVFIGVLLAAPVASAHPLGNFTVNRFSRVVLLPGHVRVDYAIDMAEIPTFQEMPAIDTDGDGAASPPELAAWATARASNVVKHLDLRIDDAPVSLQPEGAAAQLLPGQGGLNTLRFEGTFEGDAPLQGSLAYQDHNFTGRIGWQEVVGVGAEGASIGTTTVPATSLSQELRDYPQDLLSSPLSVSSMTATYAPGPSGTAPAPITSDLANGAVTTARPLVEGGPFAGVLANHGTSLMMVGLIVAAAFGAWHALLPGHGKTLMAAYMVGSSSKVRHAVSVGSAVAVMHTASVLGLGLLVLTLQQTFRPETLYPWLGLLSGLVALGLGAYLLISRLSAWGLARKAEAAHDHHDHDHEEAPDHDEAHDHAHGHSHGPGGHQHVLPEGAPLSSKGILVLALAGGILPAPIALVVLLGAIEAHRVVYGLTLVLAFSAGLAIALIAVGMGALRAKEAVARRLSSTVGRLVPVLSAGAIVGVGVYLTARGAVQI
jgi:nickel/cobalt transporter (NicO) family protein